MEFLGVLFIYHLIFNCMGFLTGGIDYDMIGRVGNHVGRKVKGKNVLAMRPAKSNKPATSLQLEQRLKFTLVASWLRRFSDLIKIGFVAYDAHMSPRNAAIGYNMLHAVKGVSPNYTMDYPKVIFSRGLLELPDDMSMAATVFAKADFIWNAPVGDSNALGTDKACFVVYNPVKDKSVTLKGVALRSALTYSLQLPPDFSLDTVECYISFISADGKLISDSHYVGQLMIM